MLLTTVMILYEQKLKFPYKIQINTKKLLLIKKIIRIFVNVIQKRNAFLKKNAKNGFLIFGNNSVLTENNFKFFSNFFEIEFEDIMFPQSSLIAHDDLKNK